MNETAQLAKFTAEMEFDKLPPQAVLMAKQCLQRPVCGNF